MLLKQAFENGFVSQRVPLSFVVEVMRESNGIAFR